MRFDRRLTQTPICRCQRGATLIVCLVMLFVTLLLGVASAEVALQGERVSRNERDRQIALQAAEAALLDAELDIEDAPDPARSRSDLFASDSAEGFSPGCGHGAAGIHRGLCSHAPDASAPAWMSTDLLDDSAHARSVPYGHFTGQSFQTGGGSLPGRAPRYLIELIPHQRAGEDAAAAGPNYLYRITAIGFGVRDSTQVLLQTVYRKERR